MRRFDRPIGKCYALIPMRVYLETLGCRLNYSEMETLGRQLGEIGYEIVSLPEQADVAVLN